MVKFNMGTGNTLQQWRDGNMDRNKWKVNSEMEQKLTCIQHSICRSDKRDTLRQQLSPTNPCTSGAFSWKLSNAVSHINCGSTLKAPLSTNNTKIMQPMSERKISYTFKATFCFHFFSTIRLILRISCSYKETESSLDKSVVQN